MHFATDIDQTSGPGGHRDGGRRLSERPRRAAGDRARCHRCASHRGHGSPARQGRSCPGDGALIGRDDLSAPWGTKRSWLLTYRTRRSCKSSKKALATIDLVPGPFFEINQIRLSLDLSSAIIRASLARTEDRSRKPLRHPQALAGFLKPISWAAAFPIRRRRQASADYRALNIMANRCRCF